jgi:hypothetical protein
MAPGIRVRDEGRGVSGELKVANLELEGLQFD